jgi:dihydroorotate dehydrogenase
MNRIFAEQGYEFEGIPFGPAAGAISGNNLEEMAKNTEDVAKSLAEGVKYGSLTFSGGVGNTLDHYPVYYHNTITGQTVNSIGLANIGIDAGLEFQKKYQPLVESYGKPLIPSISPGKGEQAFVVLPEMTGRLVKAGAKIIEVNLSCPNKITEGEQREPILGYDRDAVEELDGLIRTEVGPDITIIYKEPPFVGEYRTLVPRVGEFYAKALGKIASNFSNTIGGQRIPNEVGDPALGVPGNMGGMSGRYTARAGREQLNMMREILPEKVGIISNLGVDHGNEVYLRVNGCGADYTEGVTVFWENQKYGINFGQTVHRIAEQYVKAEQDLND